MILAMLRVMTLGLLRDRGALVLAFVLPPAIFLIFAAIFEATTNDRLHIKVAIAQLDTTPLSLRLEKYLRSEPSLRVLDPTQASRDDVGRLIRQGTADVGLVIEGGQDGVGAASMTILAEPSKPMAATMFSGQVQALVARRMPDLVLLRTAPQIEQVVGGFTPEQSTRLSSAVARLAQESESKGGSMSTSPGLVEAVALEPSSGSRATITYYAGAVAILFLLFSALQSAATLIEERNSGILDRIAVGPAGTDVVVLGKFLFLTLQGVVQTGLIFVIAALVYDVSVAPHFGLWLLTTVAAALLAAGLALAFVSLCTTRQQAQTVSTFVVLICSAIGGSMVPRFMMPEWLQDLGRFTPNTWVIEAYYGILWREEALPDVLPEILLLVAAACTGMLFAMVVSRRRLMF